MTWDLTEYERMDDMGYRSDVHALFYTTNKEDLPVLKLYMDENYPEDLHEAFDAFKTKYQDLIEGQETGKQWCFEFVRVGEDTDDIEFEQHDSSYVLSVSRQIEADY